MDNALYEAFLKNKHLLPETFTQLVTVIGFLPAFQLVQRLGGTSIPLGAKTVLHFSLTEIMGEDLATRLETAFKGQRKLYIPKCDQVIRQLRNQLIRTQFDDATIHEKQSAMSVVKRLAREYQMTERWIWEILNH